MYDLCWRRPAEENPHWESFPNENFQDVLLVFNSYEIFKDEIKVWVKLERMRREKFNFFRFAFYIEMEFCGCQENTNNSTCISMKVLFMRFLRRKTFFFHFPKSHQVPSRPRKTFIINDVIHFPFRKQSDICVDQCFHLIQNMVLR